jgi:hypothetical protein
MKKMLCLAALICAAWTAQAQEFKFGVKLGAGASTGALRQTLVVDEQGQNLEFKKGNLAMNFHFGATSRLGLGSFYLMPELYFTSVSNEVEFTDVNLRTTTSVTESMTRMDIPVLFGKKFADVFRINAGPVASLVLNRESGVTNQLATLLGADVVDSDPGSFSFGLQAGVGVDISRLTLDLRYETNLSWLGSNLTVAGKPYDFDIRSRQVMLSLGILF